MDTQSDETSTLQPAVDNWADPTEIAEFAFVLGALVGTVEKVCRDSAAPTDLRKALSRYNEVAVRQGRYFPAGPLVGS